VAIEGDRPIYSIGAVARMLDIPASTLRAWEERYGEITPARSSGAQRLYSRAQVERLRYIKGQIDAGVSAADAHRLLADEIRAGHVPHAPAAAPGRGGPLILLADTDPYAADLTEYFLRTEGWEVATALDEAQAALQFEERSPDVVVLDLLLSGGAGFRLLSQFAHLGTAHVIAVCSMDSGDESLRLGAAAFVRKPVEPLTLVSTVRDLIGTSALVPKRRTAPR
jgi:DNA-binding transcriptional MerR regulator